MVRVGLPKEVCEHAISVQVAWNEMTAVCAPESVRVEELLDVKQRGSVQRIASRVTGRLAERTESPWPALSAVFPAVTASGVPKPAAYQLIHRHEHESRGHYSGAVLVVGSEGNLDAALVLRTVDRTGGRTRLRAGAGIVGGSRPERGFEETCEKLRSVSRISCRHTAWLPHRAGPTAVVLYESEALTYPPHMPTTPGRHAEPSDAARTPSGASGGTTRRRADAERSIVSIVSAGLECFRKDPNASMTAVAQAAGVSRVTLYAHFPSREELFEAVLAYSVSEADRALEAQELDTVAADEAMGRMVRSCWRILDQHSFLVTASQGLVGEPRRRRQHRKVLDRVDRLIARGQEEGVFRADLPRTWLVTVFYSLLHSASTETTARRLRAGEAASVLERTLLSTLRKPES